jgi:hypothetical protein
MDVIVKRRWRATKKRDTKNAAACRYRAADGAIREFAQVSGGARIRGNGNNAYARGESSATAETLSGREVTESKIRPD